MKQKIIYRLSIIIFACIIVLSGLSYNFKRVLSATNLTGHGISNLEASYEGGTWTATSGEIVGTVKTTSSGGCEPTYTSQTGILTLTNNSTSVKILKFTYSETLNSGTSNSSKGNLHDGRITLAASETVTITIKSRTDNNTGETKITLSNLSLDDPVSNNITFKVGTNGTYTLNGATISSNQTISLSSAELVASPNTNYRLFGWKKTVGSVSSYVSYDETTTLTFNESCDIEPVFILNNSAIFSVSTTRFYDLNEANTFANSNGNVIVLIESGSIFSDIYTISSNNTLVIPMNSDYGYYTDLNEAARAAISGTPSLFKKLTIEEGTTINVSGSICVMGEVNANNTNYSGANRNGYGQIAINSNATINLNSGSKLYCWGFITGNGQIVANSGSKVYEPFQICDYRGGSKTSDLASDKKVFPFLQYYIQNIECKLVLKYGAEEIAKIRLWSTSYTQAHTDFPFVGTSGSMFNLNSGAELVKKYNPATDRINYEISGNASLNSIRLSVGASVNSDDFSLPIMENTSIIIKSGTTTVNQSLSLIPGAVLQIDNGAVVNLSRNVFAYDREEWIISDDHDGFVYYNNVNNVNFKKSYFQPDRTYTFTNADLVDVKVDINGILNINTNGGLFTTESKANITSSSKTGKIIYNIASPNNKDVYQYDQKNDKYVKITTTPAWLKNVDTIYPFTPTSGYAANSTFTYCSTCNRWHCTTYTVTFDNDDGTNFIVQEHVPKGVTANPGSTPTKPGDAEFTSYTFNGWDPTLGIVDGNKVYTATFTGVGKKSYTITWKMDDGTIIDETIVEYGVIPEHDDPEKAGWNFAGWNPERVNVTGPAIYTAIFTSGSVIKWNITWVDYDNTTIEVTEVIDGEIPVHIGLSRSSTAEFDYEFEKWVSILDGSDVVPATQNATYKAQYIEIRRKYTITWLMDDNSLIDTTLVEYGTTPTHSNPTKSGGPDNYHEYQFSAWSPEITSVTGEKTYTASFAVVAINYSINLELAGGTCNPENRTSYTYDTETFTLINPTKTGYEFAGWLGANGLEQNVVITKNSYGNKSYLATWSVIEYTIIYVLDGGTNDNSNPETYTIEDSLITLNNPEKIGHTFNGWYSDSEYTNQSNTIPAGSIGDRIFYAKFTINKYSIIIQSNNDAHGTVSVNLIDNVPYGTSISVNSNSITIGETTSTATPTPMTDEFEYAFTNWSGITGNFVTSTMVITANFVQSTRLYLVTINVNDIEYGSVSLSEISNVPYGTTINISNNNITINGISSTASVSLSSDQYEYLFDSWNVPNNETTITGNTTITAIFTKNKRTYQITFIYDSGVYNTTFTLVDVFTFPLSTDNNLSGTHPYTAKMWVDDNETLNSELPGASRLLTLDYRNATFTAFTGGFYHESSNTYYIEPTRSTFDKGLIKGLYKIKTEDGNNLKIHYFDEDGILQNDNSIYTFNGDSNKYVIEGGFVKSNEGLAKSNNDYYYVTDKNYLIKSGRHYLTEFNGNLNFKEGYYVFKNSFIDRDNVDNDDNKFGKIYIYNDSLYYDGILLPYGLYQASDNKYYYAMHNGTLLNNNSIYIVSSKANGYTTYQNIVCKFNNKKMYNPFTGSDV